MALIGGETFENLLLVVTPAQAGVQKVLKSLDTGLCRYGEMPSSGRDSKLSTFQLAIKDFRHFLRVEIGTTDVKCFLPPSKIDHSIKEGKV
jgi:hypothetical protein